MKAWKHILDAAPVSLIACSSDGSIRFVNQALCELTGFDRRGLEGSGIDMLLPGSLAGTTAGGNTLQWLGAGIGCELLTKSGARIPVSLSCASMRNSDGVLTGIVCCVSDQRHTRRTEQALRQSELVLGSVFDAIPDPLAVRDRDRRVLLTNRPGDAVKEVESAWMPHACDPGGIAPCSPCLVREVFEHGVLRRRVGPDPREGRPCEHSVYPIFDADGAVIMAIEHFHDISERINAEQHIAREMAAQKEAEDFAGLIIENIGDGLVVLDRGMNILSANSAYCRQVALGKDRITGRSCFKVSRGLDLPCHEYGMDCPVRLSFEDGRPHSAQHEHLLPDGSTRLIEVRSFPVPAPDGAISRVVEILKDITEQKHLQDQLHQAQKLEAIGTLAGGIAHEFNNIIGVILGNAQLASLRGAESKIQEHLDEIARAADRAAELVQQILSFSRHAKEERKPLQLRLIVKEALKLLRSTLPSSIEMRQDIGEGLPPVLADPIRIHQVLMNLCTNAKHAMQDENGVLGVALRRRRIDETNRIDGPGLPSGDYLDLEVSDSGHGLDKETIKRIFDPFFTTKAPGEGSGLGLSVVHGIVTELGGGITVSSLPGQGSTFHVLLPAYQGGDTGMNDERRDAGGLPRGRGTEAILLVDDDKPLAQLMKNMLTGLGYRPTVCTDSALAWELFQRRPREFDIVITDMTMPGINGMELSRNIIAAHPETPIILCSGFSELLDEQTVRDLGIRAYLKKPVSLKTMAHAVQEALAGREPASPQPASPHFFLEDTKFIPKVLDL